MSDRPHEGNVVYGDFEERTKAERQRVFDAQVEAGVCIICGRAAKKGTRYCGGDRGCQHGPGDGPQWPNEVPDAEA